MEARLILDAAHSGAWNMAADQYLLDQTDTSGRAAFRIYAWNEPTVSLGYFQSHTDRASHEASASLPWVRRATGGGAIVHHHELTYSLSLPAATGARGELRSLYRQVHGAIVDALGRFGVSAKAYGEPPCEITGTRRCIDPWLCFQRRTSEDLIVDGMKIAGSAQRRGRRAILQHGSVLWSASPHAPELPGITDLVHKPLDLNEFTECLTDEIEIIFGIRGCSEGWSPAEEGSIGLISTERFLQNHWNFRR